MRFEKLDDVAEIYDSLHQTPDYSDKGYPMVRVTDVKTGYIDVSNCLKVSTENYIKYTKKYKPRLGDIVISRVGTYGVFSYVNTNESFCLGQNTAIISPKINSEYLYYFLTSNIARKQIESMAVGSTQKTLSLKNIKNILVPLLNEEQQEQIAEVLSILDTKILINTKINYN